MLRFLFTMVIPVIIFLYTLSFTRLLASRQHQAAAASTAVLAVFSLCLSGIVLWRMMR